MKIFHTRYSLSVNEDLPYEIQIHIQSNVHVLEIKVITKIKPS